MKLAQVYIRFYKSFNHDQLRKAHADAKHEAWDYFDGDLYPYIRVSLDPRITTIVGANESGKTHLLSAIKKGITGQGIEQRDLCRYSPYFSVQQGRMCWPHIGLGWTDISPDDAEALAADIVRFSKPENTPTHFDRMIMFRESPTHLNVYIPNPETNEFEKFEISGEAASQAFQEVLPQPFSIDPEIALPDAISIDWLSERAKSNGAWSSRPFRRRAVKDVFELRGHFTTDQTKFTQKAPVIHDVLGRMFGPNGYVNEAEQERDQRKRELARDLLVKVACIDAEKLTYLAEAVENGDEGFANALVVKINEQLAKRLNFPKWWVQDREFRLKLTLREFDLVFTVEDRTGTEYTFAERSSGLKYFLSYLIQSRSRDRSTSRREILTMDEPDTFLSAEAQQDLLKIFDSFAFPEEGESEIQVAFVTHSPFLIDKNNAHRIRVLEKGKGLDGTLVVSNASQNHYEPMRSAFGAYVGETAFVGASNLLLEGPADQIILAGVARLIRSEGNNAARETLDLNRIVLVPCGSASQVPYMAYLIRGRDKEKPPVVALLDKDEGGDEAVKEFVKNKKLHRLVDQDLILQLDEDGVYGEAPPASIEIEDFLPIPLAVAAANYLLREVSAFRDGEIPSLGIEPVQAAVSEPGTGVFKALNIAAAAHDRKLEKIGFARAVVEVCKERDSQEPDVQNAIDIFMARMRRLFTSINRRVRKAERASLREVVGARVKRQVGNFLRDRPTSASRENVIDLLEGIETLLDDSDESDSVRDAMRRLRRNHELDEELTEAVADFEKLAGELNVLHQSFDIQRLDVSD